MTLETLTLQLEQWKLGANDDAQTTEHIEAVLDPNKPTCEYLVVFVLDDQTQDNECVLVAMSTFSFAPPDTGVGFLTSFYISPAMRGKGLSRIMLKSIIFAAKALQPSINRVVLVSMSETVGFWRKMGFKHITMSALGQCKKDIAPMEKLQMAFFDTLKTDAALMIKDIPS